MAPDGASEATPQSGPLSHIDISVGDSTESIRFYETLLTGLGFTRRSFDLPGFTGNQPQRACWSISYVQGGRFEIELRPAHREKKHRRYDRYEPGPHHIAFRAQSRRMVDEVHAQMLAIDATVLDAPSDYSNQPGYSDGYYAAFFADPDGFKLEVVHLPANETAAQ